MSYSAFLAVFLVLPILALLGLTGRRLRRFHLAAGGLVCLLAFAYTTPWDNYAVYRRLWSFSPSFVWGRPFQIGYLPLEEYLFYLAEAIFVCLTVVALSRLRGLTPDPDPGDTPANG